MKKLKKMLLLLPLLMLSFTLNAEESNNAKQTKPIIVMETTQGTIELELMPDVAPKACENLILLTQEHYYDGIVFHRTIPNFMLQTGDPTGTGRGGTSIWKTSFKDECSDAVNFDQVGLLAMANCGPNTNGSQIFITTALTPWLNGKHTIFGKVVSGYDVVQKIESFGSPTGEPKEMQKILKMYLKEN